MAKALSIQELANLEEMYLNPAIQAINEKLITLRIQDPEKLQNSFEIGNGS